VPIELGKHVGTPVNERGASPADLTAFAKEQPERARELHALRASSYIVSTAGVVGAVASGLVCYRASRAPQYAIMGFVLGGLAASAGADDVRFVERKKQHNYNGWSPMPICNNTAMGLSRRGQKNTRE
jgi:hypothetical protein